MKYSTAMFIAGPIAIISPISIMWMHKRCTDIIPEIIGSNGGSAAVALLIVVTHIVGAIAVLAGADKRCNNG